MFSETVIFLTRSSMKNLKKIVKKIIILYIIDKVINFIQIINKNYFYY